MRFQNQTSFSIELRLKRLKVKDMYNSLLGATDATQEIMLSLREELPESAIIEYLSFKGFREPDSALKTLDLLIEHISTGKTMRERTLLRKAVPAFLELTARSVNKDRVLGMLASFIEKIGHHPSYIDLLLQRPDTREILITIFSSSTYLTRLLLSLENLEGIFEFPDIRTDYPSVRKRLIDALNRSANPLNVIRELKDIEELKSGMLFLKGFIDVYGLLRGLSMLAMNIIRATVHHLRIGKGFAVIGLGGFGASEMNFSSDLDLLFLSSRQMSSAENSLKPAEAVIRYLSEYTPGGFAYKVDMRLRPDGSKGVLVNDIEGYRKYYGKHAQLWEIQSLLRARPIAGDTELIREFYALRRQILIRRCDEATGHAMSDMRQRIIHEVSRESAGYDVKNGPGGIKEIEFLIQYLQMRHMKEQPALAAYNTVAAIMLLMRYGMIDAQTGELLLQAHKFFRTVDTLLRLNEEDVLRINSEIIDIICGFLRLSPVNELFLKVDRMRMEVSGMTKGYYR
jgi:glutamate-ammonia-ligase adenylyltransferase